ncbi:unnamed protein product [Symbiodinium sp. CCMP2592]|nr:unnamed protein product [Symbiodinium sp. CCMP2592]
MDDEDTESYRSADVATLPDSRASPDSDSMDDTSDFTQLYDSRPVSPEYSGTAETERIALAQRSAAQRGPTWRRPLSAAITQQSFVDFLRITEVPLWAVVDFGTHHYFQQYTSSGADRTSELTQLLSEIRGYDMSATIEFFLLFLEGDHLETFYEDLCLQIYWSLRGGSKGQGLLESFLYTTTGSHIDSTYDPEERPTRAADTVQAIIDVLDSPVSSPNVHGGTISQVSMDGHTELSSPLADCASSAPGDTADDLSSEIETQSLIQGVALRSDITQYLQRQPSETLDDGQLALYLQFRGISFDVVMDWGTFFYLRQYEYDDEAQCKEITQHLHDELASKNIHEALCFFRYMLEGQDKEQFYVEIYKQVIYRIRSHPRPPFFADALRADSLLSATSDIADAAGYMAMCGYQQVHAGTIVHFSDLPLLSVSRLDIHNDYRANAIFRVWSSVGKWFSFDARVPNVLQLRLVFAAAESFFNACDVPWSVDA